jgi:transcriptional regulator with XRE-family HTH domain
MGTIDIIRALCTKHHTSIKTLEKELGFSNGSLAKAATIKDDRMQKIADYFNVTVDYLMTGEEKQGYYLNEETAKLAQEMYEDEDMRSLFDMKRNMPPERFKAHMEFMKNLYKQEQGEDI